MLSILISACLTTDPNVCKTYRVPLADGLDTSQCALYAPPHFAAWAEEHPGWQIKRWRCTTRSDDEI